MKLTASNNTKAVTKNLKLTITGEAPKFFTSSLPDAKKGEFYSRKIEVSGTPKIIVRASGLPAGITFDGDFISGTPNDEGKFNVTFTAENGIKKVSKKIKFNVFSAPVISTTELPKGTLNKSYNFTVNASGTKKITFGASGLPKGLKINNSGKISGKASVSGSFDVTITAKNSIGEASKTFTLIIK